MADDNDENKEGQDKPKKEKKPKKPGEVGIGFAATVLGVTLLLCLAMVFIGKMIFLPSTDNDAKDSDKDSTQVVEDTRDEVPENEEVIDVDIECIVNIAGTEGSRYLKIIFKVAYDNDIKENKKNMPASAEKAQSRLRNKAIDYLSSLTLKEVLDKNAKQNIRRDLLRDFNKSLPKGKGKFSNVYIQDYIIQ